jgi:hypothetical protein
LDVELALPFAAGGDAWVGVEVEEQRVEAFAAQPLTEALSGVPVATTMRDEQRNQFFSAPIFPFEGSCPLQVSGKKNAGLAPPSSSAKDVDNT